MHNNENKNSVSDNGTTDKEGDGAGVIIKEEIRAWRVGGGGKGRRPPSGIGAEGSTLTD